tara:strand:+ start:2484 stop:2651 length:168 start_codon:yes stop_codon:yes gene_type:complete
MTRNQNIGKKVSVRLSREHIFVFMDMLESCHDLTDPVNKEEAKLFAYLEKRLEAF